ncbi:right-handed parallel beta-helix repeat-containing protein [Mucilaginibacter polytrichastri]|uniref:right-handed parallel beta-helix repeat-containing protein n=1 Tax=Mucilaginibacter polytrichastri TaxID=1302689 RepID=UPI0008EB83DA|nr:right-handed parallel beta-helix repeat-containing protein [Mucilaginibacter polytrichastri]SFT12318.1 Right handed beta helix region [Mucilaginibacter polytrichastri]
MPNIANTFLRYSFIAFTVLLIGTSQVNAKATSLATATDSATEAQQILKSGYSIENCLPAGYVKNGSVDYTVNIQQALNKYDNVIFPAFPILINDKGLTLHTGQKVYFKKGSVLNLVPTAQPNYEMLRIHDVTNVSVYNVVIKGDKYSHLVKTGEWGMGISIRGASNINIYSAKIEQCWGDGMYIGTTPKQAFCENINLRYVNCNDNRRNGISVISARNVTILGPVLTNTSGTQPMCGLDLEPNSNKDILDNINILNAVTKNNQYGISFYLSPLNGADAQASNIKITNHYDDGSKWALQFGSKGSNLKGKVIVENANWHNNTDAIKIVNYEPTDGEQIIFKNVNITKLQDGVSQDVHTKVFNTIKSSLKPGFTGIQLP